MTSLVRRRKISEIREEFPFFSQESIIDQLMTFSQPSPAPPNKVSPEQCKHPRVQIVSRDEDSEYVECQECGDVFETSELKDMAIEEKNEPEEE
ncbi:MAG: hypothetical protein WCB56_05725 [Terriglobales bacterium]